MKILVLSIFVILSAQMGCTADVCDTNADCAPNQVCFDSGGVLFSGKECVGRTEVMMDAAFDQSLPDLDAGPDTLDRGPDFRPDMMSLPDLVVDADPDLSCAAESDPEICAARSAECGLISVVDRCGTQREAFCGTCTAPENCNSSNTCRCEPETDVEFCSRRNADCGSVTANDNCGNQRTASCGSCTGANQTCGDSAPNLCGCPCEISGVCYPEGAINPNNPCTMCDPDFSFSDWSPRTATCDDGNPCTVGDSCQNGSCVSGAIRDCSAFDSASTCRVGQCNQQTGACVAAAAPDETQCGPGTSCTSQECNAGVCTTSITMGCLISNACFFAGAINPNNPCQVCTPSNSQTSWSMRSGSCNDGDPCTVGDTCIAGICQGTQMDCTGRDSACTVGVCDSGSCIAQPSNEGEICASSPSCATNTCDNGLCVRTVNSGCLIGGVCYLSGSLRPTNDCQTCDPDVSPTSWTNRNSGSCNDGDSCTTGDTCSNGICVGTPKDCSAFNSQCSVGTCGMSGNCYAAPMNEGQPCIGNSYPCASPLCVGGSCEQVIETNSCLVNGVCYTQGQNLNCCEYCAPGVSQTALQPRIVGYSCGSGCTCNSSQQCQGPGGQACISQCDQVIE